MSIPPLILLLFPFCGGLLFGLRGAGFLIFSLFLLILPLLTIHLVSKEHKTPLLSSGLIVFSVFLLGVGHILVREYVIESFNQGLLDTVRRSKDRIILQGIVDGLVVPTPSGARATVSLLGEKGRIVLYIRGADPESFSPGDIIRFSATLRPIRNFKTPGTFDREGWWRERGILVQAFTDYPLRCVTIGHSNDLWIEHMRHALIQYLKSTLSPENAPLAIALTTGNKSWISRETKETFWTTGTGHILAVSGLHMAIVAALFGGLARFLLLRSRRIALLLPVRNISVLVGLFAALFYLLLSGLTPSATRAFLMVFSFAVAFCIKRETSPLDALALAAWIILLIDPYSILSTSFLLSFSAVFFLIWYRGWISMGNYLVRLLKIGLIAWLATLPIASNSFHMASLVAVPANLLIVPLVGLLVLPTLILIAITGPLIPHMAQSFIGVPIWHLVDLVLTVLRGTVAHLAALGHGLLLRHHYSTLETILFFSALIGGGLLLSWESEWVPKDEDKVKRMGWAILIASLCCLALYHIWYWTHTEATHFYCLDVGQGLSQVVTTDQRTVVIDAGGGEWPFDRGTMVVAPFLFQRNRHRIDYLILSHLEKDHAGGAIGLLNGLEVETIVMPSIGLEKSIAKRIEWLAQRKGVKLIRLKRPWTIPLGKETSLSLYPYSGKVRPRLGLNNCGLVAALKVDPFTILMPGDIEAPREQEFIRRFPMVRDVELLVAPHHGSRTSSSPLFLKAIRPKNVIFSYGPFNWLGLPDQSVVERYRRIGARVFETPVHGTVDFTSRGGKAVYTVLK